MKRNNHLSIEELGRIMNYDNAETNVTRDILLFSCLTGLKYSEMNLFQIADIVSGKDGSRKIELYNETPLCHESIPISPALDIVIERAISGKNGKDMLFAFPSESVFRRHIRVIYGECKLKCKVTTFTGQYTYEHHHNYMSQNDPSDMIKNHFK